MRSFLVGLLSHAATGFLNPARSPGGLFPQPGGLVVMRSGPSLLMAEGDDARLREELDVWRLRESMIRGAYGVVVNWKEEDKAALEAGGRSTEEKSKDAFVASAAAVVVGAVVLRLGGRAALVSVLGLDVVADLGIGDAVDDVVAFSNSLGPFAVLGFFGAWTVAKVFLVDFISIALAFSSGILFGGVFPGALLATTGATLGSLVAFQLSRGLAQERVAETVENQPIARALAKVVEEDGFKTVFVLRLAPILPIPLGAYSYIYGASALDALPFTAATFLGGVKPYLIDSYLGVFTKQIIDGDAMDSSKDIILLVGLGVLVLVGVFATDLAGESWDLVQQEMKRDAELRKAQDTDAQADAADKEPLKIGPLDVDAARAYAYGLIPASWKAEFAEAWHNLNAFADYQWQPTVRAVVQSRRESATGEAAMMPGSDSDNPMERLLASLATPSTDSAPSEPSSAGARSTATAFADDPNAGAPAASAAEWIYGEDQASAEDLAERRARAEWSVEGGLGRTATTSLLFTFALADASRRKWQEYPEDDEGLAQLMSRNGGESAAPPYDILEAGNAK